jgi:hypothetical protein
VYGKQKQEGELNYDSEGRKIKETERGDSEPAKVAFPIERPASARDSDYPARDAELLGQCTVKAKCPPFLGT